MSLPRDDVAPASFASTGAYMGVVAGIVFALFVMIASSLMGDSFFAPLRMIAGIVLGPTALDLATPLSRILVPGLGVHLLLSALYGTAFGLLVGAVPAMHHERATLVGWGAVFGFLVWLVNFYVLAPVLYPWFTEATPWVEFIGHTLFYGATLGLLVGARLESPVATHHPRPLR
jgi:hypothetical protein